MEDMPTLPVWWQPDVPTWAALALGVLSVVATMVAMLLLSARRPRLKAVCTWFEADTLERGFKRWHVRILNQPTSGLSRLAVRETAVDAEATIEFFPDGARPKGDIIRGIWSERPRPLRDELVVEAQRANLGPGRAWSVPIVYKSKGQLQAHQFDDRNYRPDGTFGEVPGRNLPEGDYSVRLVIHEGPRRWPFWFKLQNRTDELGIFELSGPYRKNPLLEKRDFPLPVIS